MTPAGRDTEIRVLIAEKAAGRWTRLSEILEADGDITVIGQAPTAALAIQLVEQARPDIVTVDLDLPGGGQHAIEQIMARTPTPILVLTIGVDDHRSASAVGALVAGALDVLPKPARWTAEYEAELRQQLRILRKVQVIRHPRGRLAAPHPSVGLHTQGLPVVAIGASTGGPSALGTVLADLGGLPASVLVVQHLHPGFIGGLVEWMSRVSALPVELAKQGERAQSGHVYIGPGGVHLRFGADGRLALHPAPATIHRPSADELFRSLADHAGSAGIGVLLTGMGDDGAQGLLQLHRRGGRTLAQDENSSAVFGMPRAAQRLGAVTDLLPLAELAPAIKHAVRGVRT